MESREGPATEGIGMAETRVHSAKEVLEEQLREMAFLSGPRAPTGRGWTRARTGT